MASLVDGRGTIGFVEGLGLNSHSILRVLWREKGLSKLFSTFSTAARTPQRLIWLLQRVKPVIYLSGFDV